MIRPLRRWHLRLVVLVALVVAPLVVAALAARPGPAVQEKLPGPQRPDAAVPTRGPVVVLQTTPPISAAATADGHGVVLLAPAGSPEAPGLLLYWQPATAGGEDLSHARLLGAYPGGRRVFALPDEAAGEPGGLVLYSLGHAAVVARVPWPNTGTTAP